MKPALAPRTDVECQHQAEDPDHDHRRSQDDRTDPRLALDPGPVLGRSDGRFLMIDVETRQQEQAAIQKITKVTCAALTHG